LVETNDAIRAWLDAKPKEKWALFYDYGGRRYDKTTNLEVFNNFLKTICGLPVSSII
jgi:hypothetical protein